MAIKRINFPTCISAQRIKKVFKSLPYLVEVRNININGQKRGCSGFITNKRTNKVCYITTEPFFDGGYGSGLFGSEDKAIMMRTVKSTKDYTGGTNQWIPVSEIAIILTAAALTS